MGQKHKVNALIMWSSTCLIAGILQVVVGDYVVQVAHEPVHHVQHVPAEREVHVSGHVGPAVVVMEPSFYDHHLAPAYSAPTAHHHVIAPVAQHSGPHAVAPVAQHSSPHAVAHVVQQSGPHAVSPVVQHSGPHAPPVVAHPEPMVVVPDHVPAYAGDSEEFNMR